MAGGASSGTAVGAARTRLAGRLPPTAWAALSSGRLTLAELPRPSGRPRRSCRRSSKLSAPCRASARYSGGAPTRTNVQPSRVPSARPGAEGARWSSRTAMGECSRVMSRAGAANEYPFDERRPSDHAGTRPMKCASCAGTLHPGDAFCGDCGARFDPLPSARGRSPSAPSAGSGSFAMATRSGAEVRAERTPSASSRRAARASPCASTASASRARPETC